MKPSKEVSAYMSKLGKKGGAKGKRTWDEDQKAAMVATKDATLKRKKELLSEKGAEK